MKKQSEEKTKPVTIRMPLYIYKQLFGDSLHDNRSMSKQIIHILLKHYGIKK